MTNYDFFNLLYERIWTFIPILIISLLIYIWIGKKVSSSWLSPVKFDILVMSIGTAVTIFLFFTDNINVFQFTYVTLSTVIFLFILCLVFKNKQIKCNLHISHEIYFENRLFYIVFTLYIVMTLFSYYKFGIPLFNEISRLTTYENSGGFGIIERIQKFFYIYIIFYLIATYLDKKRNLGSLIILMIPMIVFGILSGSRSSFVQIIFIFWAVKTFYKGEQPKLSKYKVFIIPFVIISVITFFIQTGSINDALFKFYERVVACGDLYWIGLGNENWDKIVINEPVKYVLNGFLTPLRLLANYNETPIGFQLNSIIVGFDSKQGPVAAYPVSSYILFGSIGGLIFTVMQAIFCGILMKYTFIRSNSILICSISYFIFISVLPFLGDAAYAMGGLANIVFDMFFLIFLLLILSYYKIACNVKSISKF